MEVNPREHVKAITLCSGKRLKDPLVVENGRNNENEKQGDE